MFGRWVRNYWQLWIIVMTDELQEKIAVLCAGQVRFHVPMREITSMRVGGRADCLAFPPTREHLASLVVFLRGKGIPLFVGGNWTNVLIRDGGFRGVLISLQKLTALRRCSGAAGDEHWEAEAGVSLGSLVRLAKEEGFSGLEFCAGIPGSVGGAVKMNAGAWGKEMRDVLESVTIMSSDGVVNTVAAEKLAFRYRALNLAPGSIIVEAMFHVIPAPREQVAARVEEILAWRKVRHPLDYPSAGSIFKTLLEPQQDGSSRNWA